MLNILIIDSNLTTGYIALGVVFAFIVIGGIYVTIVQASEKSDLIKKLNNGNINWDDYYFALNQDYKYEATRIKDFLDKKDNEELLVEAERIKSNDELENSDKNVISTLRLIENKTHKCNKCYSENMRIWNLNPSLIELRCENCKKKFTYLNESIPNVDFDILIKNIDLLYQRKELGDSNHHLRELNFKFDFEGQKSNSPITYPITLKTALEPMKGKTKAKSITPEENDARSRRILQEVKDKVWNRDAGKCVECGSNENLEFDHIIPFSKGGANTYRNLQLLCESCNRSKSDSIG
jgi:hypothetical protein